MTKIKDKVVVITGAASGIGFSIAKTFLENGARSVILLDFNEEKGTKAADKLNKEFGVLKATFFKCDVTKDFDLADKILQQYKIVDVLVNSAGVAIIPDRKKIIETNVIATIEWTYKFYEHMRTDKGGKGGTIINLASIYGFRINRYLPTYQASKFAVMGFTRSLGHINNAQKNGVKVIALCPGYTRTTMTEDIKKKIKDNILPKEFVDSMRGSIAQEPEIVGNAALQVYQNADSGTAWLIEHEKPIEEVL